jgi:transcription elongation factor SPT5
LALQLDDVNPTLDQIPRFTRAQDGTENQNPFDLSIIAGASRKAAISVLQPGDHVEVSKGEETGVHGVVDSINQEVIDGQNQRSSSQCPQAIQTDHETGPVSDNVVTFLFCMSMQEVGLPFAVILHAYITFIQVYVFSKDLREVRAFATNTVVRRRWIGVQTFIFW